jgi:metallo-beta-lactamase family protein
MKIKFLGAARQVTGSCTLVSVNGLNLLVDCGMVQGEGSHRENNRSPFLFQPADIDYLLLTHAHLDHAGMIPRLVRDGFKGGIVATTATADLVRILLYDSAHIQEKDAEWMTRKALRQGRDAEIKPLYTMADVATCLPLFQQKRYRETVHLGKGVALRFRDAGHILGSGSLELTFSEGPGEKSIIFSGDIGKKGSPIINDPEHGKTSDFVVIESTYGDRVHKGFKESVNELLESIKTTFRRGGNVLVPVFAVGRTQDLLYIMNNLVREGRLGPTDVYIDSPLAEEATQVYLSHPEYFDQDAKKLFEVKRGGALRLHFTQSIEESQAINRIKSGVVIMAGSGMCEGGRMAHHLKHNLWRTECAVVFTGFQASGTLGRRIVEGNEKVHILGEEIAVRAKIYTIGGFSAHAGRDELLDWLAGFTNHPEVFIVHGEENASLQFEKSVKERFGFKTHVPRKGEEYAL